LLGLALLGRPSRLCSARIGLVAGLRSCSRLDVVYQLLDAAPQVAAASASAATSSRVAFLLGVNLWRDS